MRLFLAVAALGLGIWVAAASAEPAPFVVVLGIAQDGGAPQAGTPDGTVWNDPARHQRVACLGIVDPQDGGRWLIDATPDLKDQLHELDRSAPSSSGVPLNGIFLTHAHMGHYLGLAHLGHEAMGAREMPVYAMPAMERFLKSNGPWDQLVRYRNIDIRPLEAGLPVQISDRISVTPIPVPHRQEYSEVVGYEIRGPSRSVLYIPDIDSWEEWDQQGVRIEERIAAVDGAYLDGTFFANGEIPGRDMSGFPHPFISRSMRRFAELPETEKAKIRFIHLNHTNPALLPDGEARKRVEEAGFKVAVQGERTGL